VSGRPAGSGEEWIVDTGPVIQALHQASLHTLAWAQAAQTVEALEAAAAMEGAVDAAMQAVQRLLGAENGPSAPTPAPEDTAL